MQENGGWPGGGTGLRVSDVENAGLDALRRVELRRRRFGFGRLRPGRRDRSEVDAHDGAGRDAEKAAATEISDVRQGGLGHDEPPVIVCCGWAGGASRSYDRGCLPACSPTMYSAYQSGQFSSRWPVRFSCSPCAAAARRSAAARSVGEAKVASPSTRPGNR